MTDSELLNAAYDNAKDIVSRIESTPLIDHVEVLIIRDKLLAALTHIQGLENRFRLGLLTNAKPKPKPPTVTAD